MNLREISPAVYEN